MPLPTQNPQPTDLEEREGLTDKNGRISDKTDDTRGHRERLRQRFQDHGPESLADYEILELLLFFVFRQQDTKPIAKALLKRFGSLAEVLSAPSARLEEVDGIGPRAAELLKISHACAARFFRDQIPERKPLSSWSQVIDYIRSTMAFSEREEFRVLFLDKQNGLLADEVQQRGTVDHTPVYPREVVRRALELSATALILVHNHPSGDLTPSRADIQLTRQLVDIAKALGITIHDHIIVSREGHVSFRGLQLI